MTFLGPIIGLQPKPKYRRICLFPKQRPEINLFPKQRPEINLFPIWTGCETVYIPKKDINISQHDDVSIFFDFLDPDGNPLDISGFQTITWIIADSVTGDILVTKSTSDSSIILPSAIRATTVVTKAETGQLPATNVFPKWRRGDKFYYHEVKGINSGGFQQTMLQGKVFVEDTRISD